MATMQEFAYAEAYNKPLLVVVLEQEALDLVESPDGAEKAWSTTPAHGMHVSNGERSLYAQSRHT